MLRLIFGLLLITSTWITTQVRAETLSIESGPRKTHLLELFTSEGCSSCPPAEAWMSRLKENPGLWRDFVPIAFHVDYWDRLGWRDPFASKAWTARQYEYSEHWNSGSVYTPGFVLDGREMQNRSVPSAAVETTGTLKISVIDGEKVAASFQPANGETKPLELHVARVGFGLNVHVKAGEGAILFCFTFLYIAAAIGGVGAGAVYGTCIGNALKWFPDRRGLCAGLTAAGFGAGSALTIIPIQQVIGDFGYESAFLWFGIGQGIVVVLVSMLLRAPVPGETPAPQARLQQTTRDYTPVEMVRSPIFWVMYGMFVLVGAGGLMATAQLAPIAKDFKVADVPVSLLGLTLPALTFALSIDRVLNGLTRPFFGWVSDNIGRENTMFIAFALEAVGIWALSVYGHDPLLFVVLSGLVFFAWGEIYSLFPSTCTDTFGTKFATTNAGLLYTAKGTAALLVPYTNQIQKMTGSWDTVFLIAAAANILAAVLAIAVLKSWRIRMIARG